MTWFYAIVREKLKDGALLSQIGHAGREANLQLPPTEDERAAVLVADKECMDKVAAALAAAGIPFKALIETDGNLAGSTPAIGLAVEESLKAKVEEITKTAGCTVWKPKQVNSDTIYSILRNLKTDADRAQFIRSATKGIHVPCGKVLAKGETCTCGGTA